MGSNQQFSLRWNNYLSHITEAFDTLRSDEDLVDVTLSCEGKRIRAHKMLLSACSTYFRDLFKENPCQHPVIIFRNVKFDDLVALIDFIYQGEVNVVQEQLSSFLTTAELLAVQGLSEGSGKDTNSDDTELDQPDSTTLPSEPEVKLFNRGPYAFQQLPGTSIGPGASVSLHPVEKQTESTPIIKRRKLSSNISISQPYPHNRKNEETERRVDQETSETNGISNDSVTGISAVPNLKMEIPEYTERNEDASSCNFNDSNRERTNGVKLQSSDRDSTSNLTQTLSTVSRETKQEPPDMYHSNLTVPPVLPPAESLIAPNLCHMLAKPGPSTENQLQDTFKSDRGIHGNDSWFSFLSNSDYLSLTDRKPDFRDRHYVCKICGKTFRNQNSCYNHMAIHKGTSKCTICECVLSSRGNMKRHMHNVHGVDCSV